MAINITSFLGGMAKGAGRVLQENRAEKKLDKKTAEQRQWEIASDARRYGYRKRERLEIKAEQAEEYISQLVAMGMELPVATELAKGGVGSIKVALKDLEYGKENNIDTSGFYKLKTENAVPITAGEISEISKGPNLVVDSDSIKNMYGTLDQDYNNHNQAIMGITNRQLNLNLNTAKGKAAFEQLEIQKNAYLKDLGRISKESDSARLFSEGSVVNTINSARASALSNFEISMNIEDMTTSNIEGKGVEVNVADLNAVKVLTASLKDSGVEDLLMNRSLAALQDQAINNLKNLAYSRMQDAPTSIKEYTNINESVDRQLKIGDIIKVKTNDGSGSFTYSIYTGTKDLNNYLTLYTGV